MNGYYKFLIALFVPVLVLPMTASGQAGEYSVKAAFLERFTRFIEWPDESDLADTTKPFIIGIMDTTALTTSVIAFYSKETIRNKPVLVRPIKELSNIDGCHVLLVSETEQLRLTQIVATLKGKPILTVGDSPGYAGQGVLINFTIEDNKVLFEVNESAFEESVLSLSHLLRRVAKIVDPLKGGL
jgi:hypothetical protein